MFPFKSITPEEFFANYKDQASVKLIDVREEEELEDVSTPLALHFPLSTFDPKVISRDISKDSKVFVLCRSGSRSKRAALILCQEGYTDVYNVEGGIMAWENGGFPVDRG
jgi:rhodanese-related sulfurtransferase